jgi:hypothetical protein
MMTLFILFCIAVMVIDEALAKQSDLNKMINNNLKED